MLADYAEYFEKLFPLSLLSMLSNYACNPGWDAGYPVFLCRLCWLAELCEFVFRLSVYAANVSGLYNLAMLAGSAGYGRYVAWLYNLDMQAGYAGWICRLSVQAVLGAYAGWLCYLLYLICWLIWLAIMNMLVCYHGYAGWLCSIIWLTGYAVYAD